MRPGRDLGVNRPLGTARAPHGPPAPPDARFAVPRLYKDGSGGILIADELVFADVASDCGQFLLG